MADFDPVPGNTLIGKGQLTFTPTGGTATAIKLRVKQLSRNIEREYIEHMAPTGNAMPTVTRRLPMRDSTHYICVIDEPLQSDVVDWIFGGASGVPDAAPTIEGSATIEFVDRSGLKLSHTAFSATVEAEGELSITSDGFSEVSIRVTPSGVTKGTYSITPAPST
jgi:hypothetical protein